MPPKLTNLFGERKVYIGTDLCDVEGLRDFTSKQVFEITKDAITITEELPDAKTINKYGSITLTMKLVINTKKIRKAIQKFLLKPRKTTYRTLRHDCAKRNGRI